MIDIQAARDRLMAVAREYAAALQDRPEIIGIAVYGSLSNGDCPDLTPFSDIDLALVFEGPLPAYFAEHRLVQGVKVDILHYRRKDLEALEKHLPYSLDQNGWVGGFLIKSLVMGRPDTILYDPLGILGRVKAKIQAGVTYQDLAAPSASVWFQILRKRRLRSAAALQQTGDAAEACQMAAYAVFLLRNILTVVANRKDTTAAAESLGIPEFAALNQQWEALYPIVPAEGVNAIWTAVQAVAGYGWEHGYQPVVETLRGAGVHDPAKLELIGDFPLFWGGYRLHEMGRIFADIDLSVRWSRAKLDEGSASGALDILWNCSDSNQFIERWKGIQDAVQAAGYDVSAPVEALLADPEYQRLLKAMDDAYAEALKTPPPSPKPEELNAITLEMERLLAGSFRLLPPQELFPFLADRARKSDALASALASLESERADAGQPQDFAQFCETREPAGSPDPGKIDIRGPESLRRWRLPTAAPLPPIELAPLNDERSWRLEDGKGQSNVQFRADGIDLTPPRYCVLGNRSFPAPMLLRDAGDQFVLQAEVTGMGGLVAWSSLRDYVHIGWLGYLSNEIRFQAVIDGENDDAPVVIGRGSLPGSRAWFRLQRRGPDFAAWCSTDAENWHDLGALSLPLEGPMEIGLYGLSFGGRDPAKIIFNKIGHR